MIIMETQPRRIARPDPSLAFLMTAIALGCIWRSYLSCLSYDCHRPWMHLAELPSGLLGAIFAPDFVTDVQHQHFNSAAPIGWTFDAIATGLW